MSQLSVETFVAGARDPEGGQYAVLQGLQAHQMAFAHTQLYPGLADLLHLHDQLRGILEQSGKLEREFPHTIKEVDELGGRLVRESSLEDPAMIALIADLIRWALPAIRRVIEEGMEIYNFVEDHIAIEDVGIMPFYRNEGYWFIPELRRSLLHLMRYEVSLFSADGERYRTLKTRVIESMSENPIRTPAESIKLSLIERYRDLPNPATYRCETDLDFPYAETMLPVAKRKFMNHLFH
jgi:hypothetical protein